MITGYALWGDIDCGENARPLARLWKETGGGIHWAYSLDTGSGDDLLVVGFKTMDDAHSAAYTDVRERMADAAAESAGGVE